MPLAGFEPATPATKLPQTYALDCAATGIGHNIYYDAKNLNLNKSTFLYMPYTYGRTRQVW
jgi:hypothetical protein